MEDRQKSPAKLTRSKSSLLRSSPTIRSSIQSLSSVNEITPDLEHQDIEEQKPHRPGSAPTRRTTPNRLVVPVLAVASLALYTLFIYSARDEIPTSENLLLALTFVAVALYLAGKNKGLVYHIFAILKKLFRFHNKQNRDYYYSKTHHSNNKPVKWFIGESTVPRRENAVIREGVEFYSNGDFYEGEFHRGRCNGSGVYNYFVNGRYEGDWVDGRYDGYGIESWSRGSRYRGQYRQGLRHGYGVYRFYTGDTFSGQWFNGQSHGMGAQTCSDGSSYNGEFKCGVKHGLGCYHFRNGDRYAGEYFGDKIHGFGVYHFANGHCYEGSWHEGRKQGYGMYSFRNGDTRCGEWDLGSLKTPLPLQNDSVLRTVQAARKAAENAINLRRVDEQVNKAVSAANKAATSARVAAVKAVQNRMDGKFCDTDL